DAAPRAPRLPAWDARAKCSAEIREYLRPGRGCRGRSAAQRLCSSRPRRGCGGRAELVHKLREVLHVVHRRVRKNTVPEIENVSGPPVGKTENMPGALLQFVPRCKQQHGIEIALHGVFVSHGTP